MKRILAIILSFTLSMSVVMLAGCGKKDDAANTEAADDASDTEAAPTENGDADAAPTESAAPLEDKAVSPEGWKETYVTGSMTAKYDPNTMTLDETVIKGADGDWEIWFSTCVDEIDLDFAQTHIEAIVAEGAEKETKTLGNYTYDIYKIEEDGLISFYYYAEAGARQSDSFFAINTSATAKDASAQAAIDSVMETIVETSAA